MPLQLSEVNHSVCQGRMPLPRESHLQEVLCCVSASEQSVAVDAALPGLCQGQQCRPAGRAGCDRSSQLPAPLQVWFCLSCFDLQAGHT